MQIKKDAKKRPLLYNVILIAISSNPYKLADLHRNRHLDHLIGILSPSFLLLCMYQTDQLFQAF